MVAMRETFNRIWHALFAPRMLYGWRRADGTWLAHTRIASSTHIEAPAQLDIADHVYIGHHNVVDASGGLTLEEGVQITTHCAVITHSSHQALRLAGRSYWGAAQPPAFVRAASRIGAYSFIGPHSVLAPGCTIGRGVLVRAHSYVAGVVADFAIVGGQPATVLGDTRQADQAWLQAHPDCRTDYEAWAAAHKPKT
jgi:acetyltransferase-like isoleucine patch superfamily enzyme